MKNRAETSLSHQRCSLGARGGQQQGQEIFISLSKKNPGAVGNQLSFNHWEDTKTNDETIIACKAREFNKVRKKPHIHHQHEFVKNRSCQTNLISALTG